MAKISPPPGAVVAGLGKALEPTGAVAASMWRRDTAITNQAAALVSGVATVVAVEVEAGKAFQVIHAMSGSTAAGTPLNRWAAAYKSDGTLIGQSPDATTTAWGANTEKTFTLPSSYLPPANDLLYVMLLVVATTVPSLLGTGPNANSQGVLPVITATCANGSGLTGTAPATLGALTAMGTRPWVWLTP